MLFFPKHLLIIWQKKLKRKSHEKTKLRMTTTICGNNQFMQLHVLLSGNSKKRMYPIMVDTLKKCENYMEVRGDKYWHKIELAPKDAKVWRQKSSTVGGNKCSPVARINRHGVTSVAGYIGKNGFNAHT
jgi:hypothetical protein